ncbi:MAG: hypothetical protein M3394_09725, partial [Actinomycetota bacterium]|nr:hypothetical protein [Actinomycetota bacterium]
MTLLEDRLAPDADLDRRALVAAAGAAVAFDLSSLPGPATVSGSLLVMVFAFGLAASGRLENPGARVVLAAVPVLGAFLALRTAPWLVFFDLIAVSALLLVAACFARGGSLADVRVSTVGALVRQAFVRHLTAPAFLAAAWPRSGRNGRVAPVVRGFLLAVPVVFLLG